MDLQRPASWRHRHPTQNFQTTDPGDSISTAQDNPTVGAAAPGRGIRWWSVQETVSEGSICAEHSVLHTQYGYRWIELAIPNLKWVCTVQRSPITGREHQKPDESRIEECRLG